MACVLHYTLLEIHIKWRFHRKMTKDSVHLSE